LLTTSTDTKEHKQWHLESPRKKNPRLASGRKRARQDVKTQRCEYLAALQIPYRGQERRKGGSGWRQNQGKPKLFAKMQAVVDTVADKGIFHKNKAVSRQEPPLPPRSRPWHVAA
jgi:small subunit ribosomal protein S20